MAHNHPQSPVAEPVRSKRWNALGCLPLLGALVFGLVAYVGFDRELSPYFRARASQHWPTAEGRIREASALYFAERKSKKRGFYPAGYEYHVLYTYTVGGKEYRGDTLRFESDTEIFSDEQAARAWIATYKPGTTAPVYYDPNTPAICTLTHDYRLSPSGLGYCAFFTALTLFCSIGAYLAGFRYSRETTPHLQKP